MFRNAFVVCILLILASMASHYAMAADSCQPVFDAMSKVLVTPSHVFSTEGAGDAGRRETAERVNLFWRGYLRQAQRQMDSQQNDRATNA